MNPTGEVLTQEQFDKLQLWEQSDYLSDMKDKVFEKIDRIKEKIIPTEKEYTQNTDGSITFHAYHGTLKDDIPPEGTKDLNELGFHAGTLDAATELLKGKTGMLKVFKSPEYISSVQNPKIIPVDVTLKKPLGTLDNPLSEMEWGQYIHPKAKLEALKANGVDGAIYINNSEARGSISIIAFDMNNVKKRLPVPKIQIVGQDPIINLKRDITVTDIHGEKVALPEGEAFTPYMLKDSKVLLQDGQTVIINKNAYKNIKGNSITEEEQALQVYEKVLTKNKVQYKNRDYNIADENLNNYKEIILIDPELDYTPPHFHGERGMFAEARVDDKLTPNGKKLLFVEETQSDYYQNVHKEKEEEKGDSPYWLKLLLKRILKEAVYGNYYAVAWTNSKQQKARWSLSKLLKAVEWGNINESVKIVELYPIGFNDGKVIRLNVDKDGKVIKTNYSESTIEGENLSRVINKTVAKKILSEDEGKIVGGDLDMGGQWAVNLYDIQSPEIYKSLTGAKTSIIDMVTDSGRVSYQYEGPEVTKDQLNEISRLYYVGPDVSTQQLKDACEYQYIGPDVSLAKLKDIVYPRYVGPEITESQLKDASTYQYEGPDVSTFQLEYAIASITGKITGLDEWMRSLLLRVKRGGSFKQEMDYLLIIHQKDYEILNEVAKYFGGTIKQPAANISPEVGDRISDLLDKNKNESVRFALEKYAFEDNNDIWYEVAKYFGGELKKPVGNIPPLVLKEMKIIYSGMLSYSESFKDYIEYRVRSVPKNTNLDEVAKYFGGELKRPEKILLYSQLEYMRGMGVFDEGSSFRKIIEGDINTYPDDDRLHGVVKYFGGEIKQANPDIPLELLRMMRDIINNHMNHGDSFKQAVERIGYDWDWKDKLAKYFGGEIKKIGPEITLSQPAIIITPEIIDMVKSEIAGFKQPSGKDPILALQEKIQNKEAPNIDVQGVSMIRIPTNKKSTITTEVNRIAYWSPRKRNYKDGEGIQSYTIRELEFADTFPNVTEDDTFVWLSPTPLDSFAIAVDLSKLSRNNIRLTGQSENYMLYRGDIPDYAIIKNTKELPPSSTLTDYKQEIMKYSNADDYAESQVEYFNRADHPVMGFWENLVSEGILLSETEGDARVNNNYDDIGKLGIYYLDPAAKILDLTDSFKCADYITENGIVDKDTYISMLPYIQAGDIIGAAKCCEERLIDNILDKAAEQGYDVVKLMNNNPENGFDADDAHTATIAVKEDVVLGYGKIKGLWRQIHNEQIGEFNESTAKPIEQMKVYSQLKALSEPQQVLVREMVGDAIKNIPHISDIEAFGKIDTDPYDLNILVHTHPDVLEGMVRWAFHKEDLPSPYGDVKRVWITDGRMTIHPYSNAPDHFAYEEWKPLNDYRSAYLKANISKYNPKYVQMRRITWDTEYGFKQITLYPEDEARGYQYIWIDDTGAVTNSSPKISGLKGHTLDKVIDSEEIGDKILLDNSGEISSVKCDLGGSWKPDISKLIIDGVVEVTTDFRDIGSRVLIPLKVKLIDINGYWIDKEMADKLSVFNGERQSYDPIIEGMDFGKAYSKILQNPEITEGGNALRKVLEGIGYNGIKDYNDITLLPELIKHPDDFNDIKTPTQLWGIGEKTGITIRDKFDDTNFKYQDAHQEAIVAHIDNDWSGKGNYYRDILMQTGDAFRGITDPDGSWEYTVDKLETVKRYIIKNDANILLQDQTWGWAREENSIWFDKLLKAWEAQPVSSILEESLKDLNIAMVEGRFTTARQIVDNILNNTDYYRGLSVAEIRNKNPLKEQTVQIGGKYPIVESDSEFQRRLRNDRPRIIEVDAKWLKEKIEKTTGEELAWNTYRLEAALERESSDSYPYIESVIRGWDVTDGGHRIAAAAQQGQTIGVAVKMSDGDKLVRLGVGKDLFDIQTPLLEEAPQSEAPIITEIITEDITEEPEEYGREIEKKLTEVSSLQRGEPEAAMLRIKRYPEWDVSFSQVYDSLAEHIGDITNRMFQEPYFFKGALVHEKLEKTIRWLKDPTLLRDIDEQLLSNYNYHKSLGKLEGVTYDQYEAKFRQLAQDYVEAHKKLPVYNEAGKLAQDAAIAIGEFRYKDALNAIDTLASRYVDPAQWYAYITEDTMVGEAPKDRGEITDELIPDTQKILEEAPAEQSQFNDTQIKYITLMQHNVDTSIYRPARCCDNSKDFATKINGDYVEGIINAGYPKRPIYHAWVEKDGIVYDPTYNETMTKEDYYKVFDAKENARVPDVNEDTIDIWKCTGSGMIGKIPDDFVPVGEGGDLSWVHKDYLDVAKEERAMRREFTHKPILTEEEYEGQNRLNHLWDLAKEEALRLGESVDDVNNKYIAYAMRKYNDDEESNLKVDKFLDKEEARLSALLPPETIPVAPKEEVTPQEEAQEQTGEEWGGSNVLYHVTRTKDVPNIIKKGILPFRKSNWVGAIANERLGEGKIYAFEHPEDAIRWSAKMDFDLYGSESGKGDISVVRFIKSGEWDKDTNPTVPAIKGKALYTNEWVHPTYIVGSTPITTEHYRMITGDKDVSNVFSEGSIISTKVSEPEAIEPQEVEVIREEEVKGEDYYTIGGKRLTMSQISGAIGWKQGSGKYKYIYPPYGEDDVIISREPLTDIPTKKDWRSAYKTLIRKHKGEIPPSITRHTETETKETKEDYISNVLTLGRQGRISAGKVSKPKKTKIQKEKPAKPIKKSHGLIDKGYRPSISTQKEPKQLPQRQYKPLPRKKEQKQLPQVQYKLLPSPTER